MKHLPKVIALVAVVGLLATRFMSRQGMTGGVDGVMPAIVTVIVLIASLYVILSKKYSDDAQKWAYGAIGTILGYWLHTG